MARVFFSGEGGAWVRYSNRSGGRSSSISTAAFFSLGPFRTSFCVDLVCCPFSFGAELSVPHCASVAGAVLRICCTAYVIFSDFLVLMFAKKIRFICSFFFGGGAWVRYYNRSGGRSSSISTAAFFSLGPFRTSFCVDLVCCVFFFSGQSSAYPTVLQLPAPS